jgi:hypothetical protein
VTGTVRYRRSRNILFRAYAGEVVLASPNDETFELLSGPAADAWSLVSEARSQAQIAQALAEAYGAPEETVAKDIGVLLEDLQRRGLIEADADE